MFKIKVVEKIKTHILCSVIFFFENRAVLYSGAGHMTIWRMRIACWVTKAKNTHHIQVASYSLSLLHNNGCTDTLQCDVTRTVHRLPCSLATEMKGSKQKIWQGGGGSVCMLRTGSNKSSPSF